ncbi:MAG: hypothetical protein ACK4JB_07900 [Reyranella sp.]
MPSTIIDDLSDPAGLSALGTRWQQVTDQVMGGVSRGTLTRETVAGRPALAMRGGMRLENSPNGRACGCPSRISGPIAPRRRSICRVCAGWVSWPSDALSRPTSPWAGFASTAERCGERLAAASLSGRHPSLASGSG